MLTRSSQRIFNPMRFTGLSDSYCRQLFRTMEDIKVHRNFIPQCPQGYHKLIAQQISKVFYQARYA